MTTVSPAPDAAPIVIAPRSVLPPGIAPKAPPTATPVGEKLPVAKPVPADIAAPTRMPTPIAWPPGTNIRPTPAATTPTMATVPHGSSLIASHA